MEKETLSNYGWIVICVLVLAVMLAFATPFGTFVADGFKATYTGLFETGDSALDVGLNAVGVKNTLECGHGRKESGDHSQKECGHFACEDCGCVPASCGVESHWSGDGLDHTTVVNHTASKYETPHTYACQCTGWIVPDGGTYYVGVSNNNDTGNYTGATATYTAGQTLPCGLINRGDIFVCGDYEYRYQYYRGSKWHSGTSGWGVVALDKSKTSYEQFYSEINGKPISSVRYTYVGCTALVDASNIVIPSTVDNMYGMFQDCTSLVTPANSSGAINITNMGRAFYGCTALKFAPDIKNCTKLTEMDWTFMDCKALEVAPVLPDSVINMYGTFDGCTVLTTPNNYKLPSSVTNLTDAFNSCSNLITAPIIPNGVTSMSGTFQFCKNIKTYVGAPVGTADGDFSGYVIPNSVTNMMATFDYCLSLQKAPTIPESVTSMVLTLGRCYSLTGTVIINANPTSYVNAFSEVDMSKITLAGSCDATLKQTLANTGKNGSQVTIID